MERWRQYFKKLLEGRDIPDRRKERTFVKPYIEQLNNEEIQEAIKKIKVR